MVLKRLSRLAAKLLVVVLVFQVIFSPFLANFISPVSSANAASSAMCSPDELQRFLHDHNFEGTVFGLLGKNGGVKLDQAAEFLADMSDITGAYYDEGR